MHLVKSAAVLAAALSLAACAPAAPPKEYAYPAWGFAVSFAAPPTTKDIPASADGARAHAFTTETAGPAGAFTVAAFDASASAKSDDQILMDAPKALAAGGTLTSQTYVATGKVVGRDVLIDKPGQATMRVRVFVANRRLYEVAAQSPKGPKDKAVEAFLDSFRVTG